MRKLTLIGIIIILALLPACSAPPVDIPPTGIPGPWVYSDLRLIDPVDAAQPALDIIAVYLRLTGDNSLFGAWRNPPKPHRLEIRLDLLNLDYSPEQDLYLALDHRPGGQHELPDGFRSDLDWDTLLVVPAAEPIQTLDAHLQPLSNMAIRILRDPSMDTLTISINDAALPDGSYTLQAQAFTTPPGETELADRTDPFSLHGSPPAPANLMLAFWNTYPAYTPAQALRRWDGAHTGPLGGRHGLYNLLRTARSHNIPLALLDLKTPSALSALDYGGKLEVIQEMNDLGLLLLPDAVPFTYPAGGQHYSAIAGLPASVYDSAAETSRASAKEFGLPASQLLYAPLSTPTISGYTHIIAPFMGEQPFANNFNRAGGRILLLPQAPLLQGLEAQADLGGPSLAVRRLLVESALRAGQPVAGGSPYLVLGGDLTAVEWGDPQIARTAFRYLSNRPWVRILRPYDLLGLNPAAGPYPPPHLQGAHLPSIPNPPATTLQVANISNPLEVEAWQAYLNLLSPVYPLDDDLLALRANYFGQVGALQTAARWSESPQPQASCNLETTQNSQPVCILASDNILAIFDPNEGALTHLFSLSSGQPHQWIAPTSQFVTGLSDPSTWDLSAGLRSDPSVIPGAFADPGEPFSATIRDGSLAFTRPGLEKNFSLTPTGIQVAYYSQSPPTIQVPVAVDPWQRYTPDWGGSYAGSPRPDGWAWGLVDGPYLEITSTTPLDYQAFTDTRDIMSSVENPNYDFPPGHYLPFPVSLVEINAEGTFDVQIELHH